MQNKVEKPAHYKPMPYKHRFWVSSEESYTEEELKFRKWVLNLRGNSGIHPDYLANSISWFATDEQALVNINQNSWFYSNAYQPQHTVTRDDFHVQPIDSQRLQWPELYNLMQKTGDYLLTRNQDLMDAHLNQPMNFVLLDINNMLKGLSQNTNINQVKEQLELVNLYIRSIEKSISPVIGSDRLFFATFRSIVDDHIQPVLAHKIETELLRDRLNNLSKMIHKISADRNRILHFALNINPVNPHPYGFSIDKPDNAIAYPTQLAKECAQVGSEVAIHSLSPIQLTAAMLKDCKDFKLLTMNEEVLDHYAAAITDLNELDRFQKVISEVMVLLGQAGEAYTIYQFKLQMLTLFQEIQSFIDHSSSHLEEILKANTLAYHHAIQQEQDLPFWKKWLSSEQKLLKTFIKNQDSLAQYPSSINDLKESNRVLKEQVGHIVGHLSLPYLKETTFQEIASQAYELNTLMNSMHSWISTQYNLKGLEAPHRPQLLLQTEGLTPKPVRSIASRPVLDAPEPKPVPHYDASFAPKLISCTPSPSNKLECQPQSLGPTVRTNNALYLALFTIVPALIALYLIYRVLQQNEGPKPQGTREEFDKIKVEVDDLLNKIRAEMDPDDDELQQAVEDYQELIRKSKNEVYDVEELSRLLETLTDLEQENSAQTKLKNPGSPSRTR